jgi:hypothetical protein
VTIGPADGGSPPPPDESPDRRAERQSEPPESLVGLINHAVSDWSVTMRLGVLLVLCVGLAVLALLLLPVDVSFGSFEIKRH